MIINGDLKIETKQILMIKVDNKQMGKSETTFGSWWLLGLVTSPYFHQIKEE